MVKAKLTPLFNWLQSLPNNWKTDRPYIFPTRFGFYFALSLLLMLAVAYIYGNNVVYFVSFFLISWGHIAMWATNINVSRTRLHLTPPAEFFADEKGRLRVQVENKSENLVTGIHVRIRNNKQSQFIPEIARKSSEAVEVFFSVTKRGYQKIPVVVAESFYPFGLLCSWKLARAGTEALVYPAREGSIHFPQGTANHGHDSQGQKIQRSADDSFQGHRPYSSSDSFRQMDWKAYARTGELLIKQFETNEKGSLQLRWEDTANLIDTEKRLSQLSLWIDLCEKQNRIYQLTLPDEVSTWGHGNAHAKECLKKLALFKDPVQGKK